MPGICTLSRPRNDLASRSIVRTPAKYIRDDVLASWYMLDDHSRFELTQFQIPTHLPGRQRFMLARPSHKRLVVGTYGEGTP